MILVIAIISIITTIYLLSITVACIGFKAQQTSTNSLGQDKVKISVLIAARNEEETILSCLNSIEKQNIDHSYFEVIVVNDNSEDKTLDVLNNFQKSTQLNFKVFSLDKDSSKKAALRLAISNASNDLIVTTDADCTFSPSWLKNIATHIKKSDMLIGPVVLKKRSGFLAKFQTLDFMAIQGVSFGLLNFKRPLLNNAANLAFKKQAYEKVGGYDNYNTPSGDDVFLLEKLLSSKMKVRGVLTTDNIVETKAEPDFKSFINQRLRWSSKAKHYKNKWLIYFSFLILFQNLITAFIYVAIVLVENYRVNLAILLLTKWLIDFILLFLVASFFNRKRDLFYFIPVQLFYPFYTLGIALASLTIGYTWKGRKI